MPGEVMQALAARKSTRDHRHEGFDRRERVGDGRLLAEQERIDIDQELRLLIGGATEHHAVDIVKSSGAASRSTTPPLRVIGSRDAPASAPGRVRSRAGE